MRFVKRVSPLWMFLCGCSIATGQTVLIRGDAAIVAFQTDEADTVGLVSFVPIEAGTTISLWNYGYAGGGDGTGQGSGGGLWGTADFATDGFMTWTSSRAIDAGTVVVMTSDGADEGSLTGDMLVSGIGGLAAEGDSIFAAQGTLEPASTSFILIGELLYGLELAGNAGWGSIVAPGGSNLPSALDFAHSNFAPAHAINGEYVGPRTGLTVDVYKSAIQDENNWIFNNYGSTFSDFDSTDFNIVPEPSALFLIITVSIGSIVAYRTLRRDL